MTKDVVLPCNGCTACCRGPNWKLLLVGEDAERSKNWETEIIDGGALSLKASKEGNCVYLTEKGCGIWEDRPLACRLYDCRIVIFKPLESVLRKQFPHVYEAAKALQSRMDADLIKSDALLGEYQKYLRDSGRTAVGFHLFEAGYQRGFMKARDS